MLSDNLVVEHLEWIARQALLYHKAKDDAADLAQETILRLLIHRDKFDGERDFKPWALTVMANIFKSARSRRERSPVTLIDERYDTVGGALSDSCVNVDDVLRAVRSSARKAVGVECVLLRAKGYSYDEIAQRTGIKTGTVKSRIAAGRRAIASTLGMAPK